MWNDTCSGMYASSLTSFRQTERSECIYISSALLWHTIYNLLYSIIHTYIHARRLSTTLPYRIYLSVCSPSIDRGVIQISDQAIVEISRQVLREVDKRHLFS